MLYWRYWFCVTQTLNWNYVCRSVSYISWSSDFALYLEDYLMDKCHNWNIGSIWCKDLPHKIYVGQPPTFRGPVISWRHFDGGMMYWRYWFCVTQTWNWNYLCTSLIYISWSSDFALYLEDYLMDKYYNNPCDAKIYHTKCMWVSDLHFMVQWFCLISWRLFDGLMLYCRYWFNVTQTLNWNYICRPVTYISWSSDFALYLEDYLMDKCHNYIVFFFLFVHLYVRSFVRNFIPFVELLQSFTLKQIKWRISHQPLIRKHSYLNHRYPGGSAFIPWLLTPGSMPRGGARGQNLGHL